MQHAYLKAAAGFGEEGVVKLAQVWHRLRKQKFIGGCATMRSVYIEDDIIALSTYIDEVDDLDCYYCW